MILFAGYGTDPALRLAIEAAERDGVPHVLLDQLDLRGSEFELWEHGAHPDGIVRTPQGEWRLAALSGAYARPLSALEHRDTRERARGQRILADLVTWLDIADARILSRPRAMHSNSSKPYQAQLIAAAGFAVPDSIVTSDPAEVEAFVERVGPVIFKSISGVRSIVRRLDDGYRGRLERVRLLPTQFQALIEGEDVRAHVVGDEVYATRILSTATDYRYAMRDGLDAELAETRLPDEVASRCVELSRSLGLPLVGIDLRRTPEGEYVCFEANPMPGYSYYESHTGQPISGAIVRQISTRRVSVAA